MASALTSDIRKLSVVLEDRTTESRSPPEPPKVEHHSIDSYHKEDDTSVKCSVCSELDEKRWRVTLQINEVRDAATKGCQHCKILAAASSFRGSDTQPPNGLLRIVDNHFTRFRIGFISPLDDNPVNDEAWELFTTPGKEVPWAQISAANMVTGDTSSDVCLENTRKWLSACQDTHASCTTHNGALDSVPLLPKRIIDVTPLDEAGSARLVETDGTRSLYLCLSHCWGTTHSPVKTTTANLEEHKKQIAWSSLPRTFQDAIDFVRRLGQRYVWIDSLCIVQDDYADWDLHAVEMASIYQNSFLTLAGTKSSNSMGGLYSFNPKYQASAHTLSTPEAEEYTVYSRKQIPHWYGLALGLPTFRHMDYKWHAVTTRGEFPLLNRAWVFQERFLSPRTLHFCEAELVWECCEHFTCECVDGVHDFPETYPKIRQRKQLQDLEQRPFVWRQIVEEYTSLRITKPMDRIPALQGIATQLLSGLTTRIISGLWEASMLKDMLWFAVTHHDSSPFHERRSKEWRAPSWSWASNEGCVRFEGSLLNVEEHARIMRIEISNSTEDRRAIQTATSMKLSARLLRSTLVYQSSPFGSPKVEFNNMRPSSPQIRWANLLEGYKHPWPLIFKADWHYHCEGKHRIPSGSEVFCARLATVHNAEDSEDVLLILRALDGERTQYERIGLIVDRYIPNDTPASPGTERPFATRELYDDVEEVIITIV